jgi:peptide/nickel transport system permease protein
VIGFLLRRTLLAVPILIGVSIVVFVTIKLIPGDPVSSLLGPTATPEDRARLVAQYGLDRPLLQQYVTWLGHVLQGDLGRSIARQTDVLPMVTDALWNTLILTGFAFVLAVVGGLVLGTLTALRRGRPEARVASGFTLLALSAPQYTVGLVLIIYLAVETGWFPAGGMYTPGSAQTTSDLLHHVVLPGVTAALVPMGILARMFRSSLLDVLGQDFIEALRARGLTRTQVLLHALHNAVPSMLTIAGLQFGYLLGGVVFVETIFSWPGLGLLVFQSISQRDLTVIQAGVLCSACAFVLVNLVVDGLQGFIDPRVRVRGAR